MRLLKKSLIVGLCAIFILGLGSCGSKSSSTASESKAGSEQKVVGQTYNWRLGSVDAMTNPNFISLEYLVKKLEETAPGKWDIELYPSSQLGNASEMIESVQMGTLDLSCPATAFISNFVPEYGVLDMPYLLTSTDHVDAVFDGPIGQELADMTVSTNIKTIAFWEVGFRCLANDVRPINSVEDVKGLRLRIMSSEVHKNLFSALGADPVPMSLSEAYTAIQNKTIDGMDNPLHSHIANSTNEVCKYFAVTNHVYSAMSLIMSLKAWNSMTEEDQKIFMECAKDATQYQRKLAREQSTKAADKLENELGCVVTTPDLKGFEEKMDSVYSKYPQYEDMIERIKAEQG